MSIEEYENLKKQRKDILYDMRKTKEAINDKFTNYLDKREFMNDLIDDERKLEVIEAQIKEYENGNNIGSQGR